MHAGGVPGALYYTPPDTPTEAARLRRPAAGRHVKERESLGPTVAIMQPYFLPYAGYFRLVTGADTFVIYDCVQFPRRGWVHRNKLRDRSGAEQWLTLPLQPAPQDVRIDQLAFPDDASAEMERRLAPFPLETADGAAARLLAEVRRVEGRPVDYIARLLQTACAVLDAPWNVVWSSSLEIPAAFRGQDRILEICRRLEAARYINAPGGRELYDSDAFRAAGVRLQFLPTFTGTGGSILQRLIDEPAAQVRADLFDWTPED